MILSMHSDLTTAADLETEIATKMVMSISREFVTVNLSDAFDIKKKSIPPGMEIRVKKRPNNGLLNPPLQNLCWLNSVLQLLEVFDIPLFLQGKK